MAVQEELLRLKIATDGNAEVAQLSKTIADLAQSGKIAEEQLRPLVDEFVKLAEQQRAVTSIAKLKAELQETGDKLFLAKRGLAELNKEFGTADGSSRAVARAFAAAEKSVAELTAQQKAQELALLKTNNILNKYGVDLGNLDGEERRLAEASKQAAVSLQQLGAGFSTAAQGARQIDSAIGRRVVAAFKSAGESVSGFVQSLGRVTGVTAAVSAAISALSVGRVFIGAVQSARDFESALSEVRAVSGASAEQLTRMKAAAEQASASTKFGALEAAQALGELARASGDADQAITQLPATLNLAQAAGIGASESANILTTTLTQFGLAAGDAGRVADLFAREANSTQDTVSKLGLAMSYVAPLAKQLGLNIEQTTAVLGAMAEQGFRGERAGTALRNVFSALLDPTSHFSQALYGLGINSSNFVDVINGLSKAGERGKRALLSLDSEARPAITALVTSGGAGIERLIADFQAASGEAERTAQTMGGNFEGAASRLKNAFDAIRRSLVDPILEPLAQQFDEAAVRLRAFAQTADFAKVRDAVVDLATQGIAAIRAFIESIDFSQATTSIAGFLRSAGDGLKTFGENVSVIGRVVGGLAAGIGLLTGSLQLVFQAVTSGAAKALSLVADMQARVLEFAGAPQEVIDRLREAAKSYDEYASEHYGKAGEAVAQLKQNLEQLNNATLQLGQPSSGAAKAVDSIGAAAERAKTEVADFASQLGLVPDYTQGAANAVEEVIGPIQALGKEALLAADRIDKPADALQQLGGGPVSTAVKSLRDAEDRLAGLVRAGNATPAAMAAAERGVREASAEVERLRAAAEGATQGTDALTTALAALGLQSPAQLKATADAAAAGFQQTLALYQQGQVSIQFLGKAFDAYAQKQLELAQASSVAEQQRIVAELRVQAALAGTSSQVDALIASYLGAANAAAGLTSGLQQAGTQGAQGLQQVQQQANQTGEALKKTGEKGKEAADEISGASAALSSAIQENRQAFLDLSDGAAAAFDRILFDLSKTQVAFGTQHAAGELLQTIADAAEIVRNKVDAQRQTLDAMVASLQQYGQAGASAFGQVGNSAEQTIAQLEGQIQAIQAGRSQFDLLGQEDLGRLQSALEEARSRVEALQHQAEAAKARLSELGSELQDQIDQINGNQSDIETRRYQEQLEQIAQLEMQGGEAAAAEAEARRKQAEALHQLKLRQIAEQAAAQKQADDQAAQRERAQATSATSSSSGSASASRTAVDLNLNVNGAGGAFGLDLSKLSVQQKDAFARELGPSIIAWLKRQKQLAGA